MDRLGNSSQCAEQDSKHVPREPEAQQLQRTSSLYPYTKPHGNATAAHNRPVRRGYIDDKVWTIMAWGAEPACLWAWARHYTWLANSLEITPSCEYKRLLDNAPQFPRYNTRIPLQRPISHGSGHHTSIMHPLYRASSGCMLYISTSLFGITLRCAWITNTLHLNWHYPRSKVMPS